MKIYITLILNLCAITFLSAQVGVNTDQPTRALDVNGDLRVRELKLVNKDANYNNVVVVNKDGEVEKHDATEITKAISDLSVETKELYFETTPDGTKIVPCGKFNFRFSSTIIPEIASVTDLPKATTVYLMRIRKYATDGKSVSQGNTSIQNSKTFSVLDSNYKLDQVSEYNISYPGDSNLYRVIFLARKMTSTTNSYSIVCEKF
ncbi:hypothetical protein SAMN05421738_10313 [Algoriella xinjiangensis]|uniref:Uncharacterized protein n=1 Tax=Algoriella xinjiangensis TaxID=684065 RepID=A0A1I4U0Z0_9FLAO|nr:hypothetical protein [Algoriella xinjiangensis]SFM82565.1 hypothetical protein SAMN05421738_10313 [Algoriella xinjiangensis]VDH17772.1 Uncharacterised protein [Algoriella xinjiangensis]